MAQDFVYFRHCDCDHSCGDHCQYCSKAYVFQGMLVVHLI